MQRPSSIFGKRKTSADMKDAHRTPARRCNLGRRSLATIGPGCARQMDCTTTGRDDPAQALRAMMAMVVELGLKAKGK